MYNKIILVLFAHFVGDFLLQSNWMAQNKSKHLNALTVHVMCYMTPLFFFGFKFALINGLLHFCVDFVTSRVSSKLWEQKKVHWFFVIIGLDQFIHSTCLILTMVMA